MKIVLKAFLTIFVVCIFIGCQQNEIRECKGVVTALDNKTLSVIVDGDSICFEARDMRITNGVLMPSDSVKISYIGRLDGEAKALIASLIPKSTIIDAVYNPNKKLETIPLTEEQKQRLGK